MRRSKGHLLFTRRSAVLAAVTVVAAAVLPVSAAQAAAPAASATTRAGVAQVTAVSTTRAEVLKRAAFWFKRGVPYSQQRSYPDPQGKKYRTDSSGYVSMAWGLPDSLTTQTLPTVSHPIAKDELLPGDVLLNPDRHVLIFAGWANKEKTMYVAYEQTPPRVQHHAVPYPSYDHRNEYLPYRYNNIK
jgi:hypothetical protein